MYDWSCPSCGKFIKSEITYRNGSPVVIYNCDCGWNSLNQTIAYSDRIEYKKENNNE